MGGVDLTAFFYLLLLIPVFLLPVRFHLCLRIEGEDEFFLLEMIFLNLYIWSYQTPVEKVTAEGEVKKVKIASGKGPGLPKKKEEKALAGSFEALVKEALRIITALRKYGFGGALFSLFLPEKYRRWMAVAQRLEERGRFLRFNWSTTLGFEDPALAGLATGLVWAVKGAALGIIQRGYGFAEEPRVEVHPSFFCPARETLLDCIFEIRLGHIIFTGLQKIREKICDKGEVEEENA